MVLDFSFVETKRLNGVIKMGWIGTSLLIAIMFTLYKFYTDDTNADKNIKNLIPWMKKTGDNRLPAIMGFVIPLVVIGLFGGIYTVTLEGKHPNGNYEDCEGWLNTWDVVSVVRDKETSSSFILGTGGSHTVDRYYVYRQEEKGLLFTTYKARTTYIVERDAQPQYSRLDHVCPMPVYDFLWWSSGTMKHNFGKTGTLYVPKNTILREFKI